MAVKCDSNLILSNYGTLHAKLYTTFYCTWLSFNWIVFNRLKNAFISHTLTYSTHLMVKKYFLLEGRRKKGSENFSWKLNQCKWSYKFFLCFPTSSVLTTIKSDNIYLWKYKRMRKIIYFMGLLLLLFIHRTQGMIFILYQRFFIIV